MVGDNRTMGLLSQMKDGGVLTEWGVRQERGHEQGALAKRHKLRIIGWWQKLIAYQAVRFLLVGALNTLVGYSFFAFFLFIGLHYALASFLAQALGVVFNFFSTGNLVFRNHDVAAAWKFALVYSVTYLLNVMGLNALVSLSVDMYLAGALLTLPMAAIAYLLNKNFVFGRC
ncbi:GtrA family protein [Heliophilum fasciatum]|uniref:Putative flippase GtrA n=1 Tax=Heliophilum fasciatum TaxID=35700 RepID=A0A4R2RVY8_9FIRM|nr:GtrA family protein [Heliophilum fasciatum]MCW2277292.1 putative flippase GtrA [Heliophilum fasciatum]TCP67129.1 putative flippase GtrA [Heliophilum fasciatum]